ncbi:hypothetical protein [Burkholderia stagnalis]|uniref:hypothetical protein n=1 Tax=Burkholderia stagnalis TaxID=1503054 RepID=UPI000AD0F7E5|nr:hypothetical protein [Burkholderia stagnalis]MDY7807260.1 hypothetical protein [Burkholderia stagnalis]
MKRRSSYGRGFAINSVLAIGFGLLMRGSVAAEMDVPPPPNANVCWAVAINGQGFVAADCATSDGGNDEAFVLAPNGESRVLPALTNGRRCDVIAINDGNVVAGMCEDATGAQFPVTWPVNGGGAVKVSGAAGATIVAINAQGQLAGVKDDGLATLWKPTASGAYSEVVLPKPGLLGLGWGDCISTSISDVDAKTGQPSLVGTCQLRLLSGGAITKAIAWTPNGLLGTYVATSLPDLGTGDRPCEATKVNIKTQAIGTCEDADGKRRAVFWPSLSGGDSPRVLEPGSAAIAMNAQGQIIGKLTVQGESHGFFWDPRANAPRDDIGTLGGRVTHVSCVSGGAAPIVVGKSETSLGQFHAFKWTRTGGMVDLGTLPGGSNSGSSCVNDAGRIAGASEAGQGAWHVFVDQ